MDTPEIFDIYWRNFAWYRYGASHTMIPYSVILSVEGVIEEYNSPFYNAFQNSLEAGERFLVEETQKGYKISFVKDIYLRIKKFIKSVWH